VSSLLALAAAAAYSRRRRPGDATTTAPPSTWVASRRGAACCTRSSPCSPRRTYCAARSTCSTYCATRSRRIRFNFGWLIWYTRRIGECNARRCRYGQRRLSRADGADELERMPTGLRPRDGLASGGLQRRRDDGRVGAASTHTDAAGADGDASRGTDRLHVLTRQVEHPPRVLSAAPLRIDDWCSELGLLEHGQIVGQLWRGGALTERGARWDGWDVVGGVGWSGGAGRWLAHLHDDAACMRPGRRAPKLRADLERVDSHRRGPVHGDVARCATRHRS
jgi:hypothetical protein